MKNIFLVVLVVFLSVACKEKPSESTAISSVEKTQEEPFKELLIVINFKTNKADTFKLMLNNIEVDDFQKKNIHIFEDVISTNTLDVISANFGINNISNQLHISLGNKEEKVVTIETINISYGKNSLSIESSKLKDFFFFNKFISQDEATSEIKTKKVDGKHSPIMFIKKKAITELTK